MKSRIAYITLGCKLNYAETSTYERKLNAEGFEAVPWNKGADIFLVNTCTVTEHSDKKSRNIIRKLHRQCPEAKIYVTGCYAQLKKAEIEAIEGVTAVFGAEEKSAIVPTILAGEDSTYVCDKNISTFFPAYSSGERTRSFLKVQDGCDYKCAYCTVPYARGESRNIPIDQIIPQAEAIAVAKADERVQQALEGKQIVKEIYIPGKIINIVAK
jgi:threonylcarbamoyladenosine tRNA methylthiotransferase MtaB